MIGHEVHEGCIAGTLIDQNKGTLRSPMGLSRVSHPTVCLGKVNRGWINDPLYSSIIVPIIVRAPQVSTEKL